MRTNGVRCLLMGGQACVLYGGAEFSRDTDLAVLAEDDNLRRLQTALDDLEARSIAVPPFERRHLEAGHAVHFRCWTPDARGLRIDVMSRMRGLPAFEDLWDRRTTIETDKGPIEVLGLPDLVTAKKTQRDKDWPMITRLLEAHYVQRSESPVDADIDFWLRESRTPAVLIDVARSWRDRCRAVQSVRPLLVHAIAADEVLLNEGLRAEETREREADRAYWEPLKRELEALRRARRDVGRA
jgi:hypothetical protein